MTVETEVVAKARRRRFTAAEKLRVLKEAAGCTKLGALGVLLRREGLYSSHLATWRVARQRGELAGLTPRAHGPKAKPVDPRDRQLAEQTREIARLQSRLDVFSKPIRIDGGDPIGRVGTTLMRDGSALVSWLETESGKTTIKVRQVTASGGLGSPKIVAELFGSGQWIPPGCANWR